MVPKKYKLPSLYSRCLFRWSVCTMAARFSAAEISMTCSYKKNLKFFSVFNLSINSMQIFLCCDNINKIKYNKSHETNSTATVGVFLMLH